jgi:hypothetical protein
MKRLLFLLGGVIVLCLAACGFWYWINIPPQIKIPTPVMPHPNGFDYFRRAGAAFVKDTQGVNVSTDSSISNQPKQYPLAPKEAWLKKNAKAFQLLREGLKYPALHVAMRFDSGDFFPEYAQYRHLAYALVVESHARGERGDWDGAVQSALDDYHFGNQIARGGTVIFGMAGAAVRAISLNQLGVLVAHSNATSAKFAAANMEGFYDERYPYSETLQEEKWFEQSAYLEAFSDPSWRIDAAHNPLFQTKDYSHPSWRSNAQIFFISKRKLMSDLTNLMDVLIENAHRPYVKQEPVPGSGIPSLDEMLPTYKYSHFLWARENTFAVEVMTMYALRAYKLDNGHYPKNLKVLLPTYLHKIPIDPFDGIAPLHYQLQGNKYLLWSIGPDGVDNHGTPIINTDTNGSSQPMTNRQRYLFMSPNSKGDVVAGVNMP